MNSRGLSIPIHEELGPSLSQGSFANKLQLSFLTLHYGHAFLQVNRLRFFEKGKVKL